MTGNQNGNSGNGRGPNVVDFAARTGRTGFTLTPTTTMPTPVPAPPTAPPTQAANAAPTGRSGRRSPMGTLNALADPGLTAPLVTVPQPGTVPATFQNAPAPAAIGPRLGALSLAAVLAIAVAALRGIHSAVTAWQANREQRQAVDQVASDGGKKKRSKDASGSGADSGGGGKRRKVPAGHEYGWQLLSGSGGKGPKRSGGSAGSGGGWGTGGKKRPGAGGGLKPGGWGRDLSGGSGGSSGSKHTKAAVKRTPLRTPKDPKGTKPEKTPNRTPRKTGPDAGTNRASKTPGKTLGNTQAKKNAGSGRTRLAGAATKQAQKSAARRLKRRRKQLNNPMLWKNKKNTAAANKKPGKPGSGSGKKQASGSNSGRTTLTAALRKAAVKAARRRLKQRRRTPVQPPIWSNRRNKKSGATGPGAAKGPTAAPGKPNRSPGRGARKNKRPPGARAWQWVKARANAQQKASSNPGPSASGPGPAGGHAGGSSAQQPGNPGAGQGAGGGGYGRTGRQGPFQNAGQASHTSTITVEREDHPGAQAKRWQPQAVTTGTPALPATGPAALQAAPTTNPPRPGTTRPRKPIPMPPASRNPAVVIAKARKQAARTGRNSVGHRMHEQHATEISLDDALDEYGDFKDDAFKTHDQSSRLADRARKLRDTLIVFADDLATNHNLIGPLFSGAMARMAESMDLVARMADEMQTSSLQAAEMSEAADNDLNDAYRPYNTATADAGLTTPSAPIHNET